MEALSSHSKIICNFHPNNEILFVKINNLDENSNIFYCQACIESDYSFYSFNYVGIKSIIDDDNSILQKWQPYESQINEQVNKIYQQNEIMQNIPKIQDNIKKLRHQINKQIDIIEKQTLRKIERIYEQNQNILDKIQDQSFVNTLKEIIINQKINSKEKEQLCREFIILKNQKHSENNQQIEKILNQKGYTSIFINSEIPQDISSSIYQLIQKINFFPNEEQLMNNNKSERQQTYQCINSSEKQFTNNNNFQTQFSPENQYINHKRQQTQNPKNQLFNNTTPYNQSNQIEDILHKFNLIKSSNLQCFPNELERNINNSMKIISRNLTYDDYYFSNILLEKYKKYVFRFSFEINQQQSFNFKVGVINDQEKIYKSQFLLDTNLLQIQYNHIDQQLFVYNKYIRFNMTNSSNIYKDFNNMELRIHLNNKLISLHTYPNYAKKFNIPEQYMNDIFKNRYRLFIYLDNKNIVNLTNAYIVDSFSP